MVKASVGNFLLIGVMAALFILLFKSLAGVTPDNSVTKPVKALAFAL